MSSVIDPSPPYVGYSLRVVWQWVWELNMAAATRAGYDDVNPAHVSLFRYPGLDGYRLTDIAHRMQITKQSVHQLLGHLESLGYLIRETDPSNRRARLVRLTPKGRGLQEVIRRQALDAERRILDILGEDRGEQFKESIALLVDEITADGGVDADDAADR